MRITNLPTHAGATAGRRFLLVSYHFPPDRAVGAKRWEKLSRFAVERGWGIDVLTCWNPEIGPQDAPGPDKGINVFRIPAPTLRIERLEHRVWRALQRRRASPIPVDKQPEAQSAAPTPGSSLSRSELGWLLHTRRGWMRAYWSSLDFARISAWGAHVERIASKNFVPGVHRAVIASGPPFMSHDVGRRISTRLGIPFVMDMRDPWSHVERLAESIASPLWPRLAARYERRAVKQAALIVTNTDVAREQMVGSYPERAADILTVMNGVDDEPLPRQRRSGRFIIAHAGTIYLDRDPRGLFVAAARVIRELSLTPENISLEFIGDMEAVGGFPILETARSEGIADYVSVGPPRPHKQALEFMANASMLITMSGSNMAAIPAKTFECVRFPAWVLALSASGSATERLLGGSGADIAIPTDVDRIAEIIRGRYLDHARGLLPEPIGTDPRFSRAHQAGILFDALDARTL